MIKGSLAGAALCVLAFGASAADVKTGAYVRADIGYDWMRDAGATFSSNSAFVGDADELEDGPSFSVGAGYQFTRALRADLTVAYRDSGLDGTDDTNPVNHLSGDLTSWSAMVTGYVDINGLIPNGLGRFRPYVGAGIGVARNKLEGVDSTDPTTPLNMSGPGGTKTNMAWQLVAGSGVVLTDSLMLDIGYHYVDLGKFKADSGTYVVNNVSVNNVDGFEGDLRVHELTAGLRYQF